MEQKRGIISFRPDDEQGIEGILRMTGMSATDFCNYACALAKEKIAQDLKDPEQKKFWIDYGKKSIINQKVKLLDQLYKWNMSIEGWAKTQRRSLITWVKRNWCLPSKEQIEIRKQSGIERGYSREQVDKWFEFIIEECRNLDCFPPGFVLKHNNGLRVLPHMPKNKLLIVKKVKK